MRVMYMLGELPSVAQQLKLVVVSSRRSPEGPISKAMRSLPVQLA